jgi:ABC-type antimicrobial peptide transport system permease subunit
MFLGEPEVLRGAIPSATYARRAHGVSVRALVNELRARYEIENPDWDPDPGARPDAMDGLVMNIAAQREAMRQLELLLAGSVLLALVAAANLSLFLLARAPGRRRELGVRLAVGAPKRRLARQLATEAGLLVVASGVAGLVGSVWLAVLLKGLPSLREANWLDATLLDWRVAVLVAALLLVLGLAVSLAPIQGLKRVGIATASRSISARASFAQRLAGTAQIAIAAVLMAAAVAFGWHLTSLVYGDAGYELTDRFVVEYLGGVAGTPDARILAREHQREAIEAIPSVSAVAYGYPIPGNEETGLFPRQLPDPRDPSRVIEITRGGLEDRMVDLLGYDLLFGRAPKADERGVVVVNQSTAQALFGRDDVVGERLYASAQSQGFEIVGVLKDLSFGHPLTKPRPYAFEPIDYITYLHAVIEAQLSAADLQQALARLTRDGVLEREAATVRPLEAVRFEVTAPDRVRGAFTIAAALLVVFLSGLGFYGTQRYLVAAGRREYAIRASLGAGPGALWRLVILRATLLGLPGLVLGGFSAFIVVAWLRGDFVSRAIAPVNVTILVLAGLIALLLAASIRPASVARRTQPAALLRED